MKFIVQTKGHYDFLDITGEVREAVKESDVKSGAAIIYALGTTVGLTIMEYEQGVAEDLKSLWERLAPEAGDYEHHKKWGDHNGAAHVKSALLKTDLTVPVENSSLTLGTWQSVVLIDFDEKPRKREVIVQIMKS